jgi:tetratricopeptide (TPR) repeat protein/CHAT domain-containing protein
MAARRKLKLIAGGLFVVCFFSIPAAAQEARWKELNEQAGKLYEQGKYAEAVTLTTESVRLAEVSFGPEDPRLAASLRNLGKLYFHMGHYAEAEPLYQRALHIKEKALGAEHPSVAATLYDLAALYQEQGRYPEAEPLCQRALLIDEKALGPEHPGVAADLNSLAQLYRMQGRYAEAAPLYQRALGIDEKALGPDHPNVAMLLNNLALVYLEQGRYAEAEPRYQRAVQILEKTAGPEDAQLAGTLNNLAELYREQGRYSQAEPLYLRAVRIHEKAAGTEGSSSTTALGNLAQLYKEQGRYAEAEPLYQRALRIDEKAFGPEHPAVAKDVNNLAELYWEQGRYPEAESLYQRAIRIHEKTLGPDHPDLAANLNNLAALYQQQSRYAEAEPLYQRALRIDEKARGPEHPDTADTLNNLAALFHAQGRYVDAEPLFQRGLEIRLNSFGLQHPQVAESLNNLGELYRSQGRYAEARAFHQRALAIREKALGPEHPLVGSTLSNLAVLEFALGKTEAAQLLFARSLELLFRRSQYSFTYMSEKERLQFLDTVSGHFPLYFSFCVTQAGAMPALAGDMYDVVLWEKGFIARSIAALRAQIAATGDSETLKLFDQLTTLKQRLASLRNRSGRDPAEWQRQMANLQLQANETEKQLVQHSVALQVDKSLERVTWRDVQKALRPGEAAVEVIKFHFHDGKEWTDAYKYAALLLVAGRQAAPQLVVLGTAKELEGAPMDDYRAWVAEPDPEEPVRAGVGIKFTAALWEPLEKALGGAKRVYVSTDGVLNQVSLAVMPRSDGKLLLEAYDLRLLTSTKDLLRQAQPRNSRTAVLLGNPSFQMTEAEQQAAVTTLKKPGAEPKVFVASTATARTPTLNRGLSRDVRGEKLNPLPGTQQEVETVTALLATQHWETQTYTQQRALEEAVKQVQAPRVVHLATHGFFETDQQVRQRAGSLGENSQPVGMEDPMLRSGLFLAGAQRTLSHQSSTGQAAASDLDDGVLTAYEATQLNLQGTELVVLSACETGLGKTQNGEGVFGLRRALQEAGTETVLMSLWSVPDQETRELMTLFYQKWLAGKDKADALREAQQEMRQVVRGRYGKDAPFYWGAFVLVGR